MKNKLFIVLLACLTQMPKVQSQDTEKLRFDGNTIIESYVFAESLPDKEDSQNEWKTNINLNYLFNNAFQLKTSTQINLNTVEDGRTFIEPRELYLNLRHGKFNTSVGMQIINWSGLAGWSAADIPNTYQYYDFLDTEDEERGQWTFKSTIQQGSFQFTATVIPFFRVSSLFFENNRWITLPTEIQISETTVPLNFTGSNWIRDYDELQLGLKLSFRLGESQQTIIAYHGYNDIPVRSLSINEQDPDGGLDFTLNLIYHKLQFLSWQSEFYAGQWNIWSEANITESRILENDRLTPHVWYNLTIGTDRNIEFYDPEKQLNLLFQYIYSFNNEGVTYGATDLDHIFNNAALARIKYQFNYKLKGELRTAFEFQQQSYYINPKIEYTMLRNFKLSAGADILFGNRESFFGNYQDNSRMRFAVSYYF